MYEDDDPVWSEGDAINKLRLEINKIAEILDKILFEEGDEDA